MKLNRTERKYACAVNHSMARWRPVARSWNAVSANRCLTKKVCVNRVLPQSKCRSNYGSFVRQTTCCLNENKRWEESFIQQFMRFFLSFIVLLIIPFVSKTNTCQTYSRFFFFFVFWMKDLSLFVTIVLFFFSCIFEYKKFSLVSTKRIVHELFRISIE